MMMARRKDRRRCRILHGRYVKENPSGRPPLSRNGSTLRCEADFDLRKEARLSHKELAVLVGTTQSVFSRLEDADYDGHSLTFLNRIAGR